MAEKKDDKLSSKKITKKASSVKTSPAASTKKAASSAKSTSVKRQPVKKQAVKKRAVKTAGTQVNDTFNQSLIEELNVERKTRDKQISTLIEELRQGLNSLSDSSNKQNEEHKKEMAGLYQSLQGAFTQIKDNSIDKDNATTSMFRNLSDSMMKDHEHTLVEINEQSKLQDKKIEYMTSMLEQRTRRNRLIAVPGFVLAIIGVVYMFYVVSVME